MSQATYAGASRTRSPSTFSTTLVLAASLAMAACEESEPNDVPEENPDAASWRAELTSDDAELRVRAVDKIPGAPGSDGLGVLEQLAVVDPDARVREQAVLAYVQLARQDGVSLLKDVALGDPDEAVASAALASLEQLREDAAEPPRAWMDVEFPSHIEPGGAVAVKVRFGSTESAPKAMLQLRLPEGFTFVEARGHQWKGQVAAGETQEVVFRAVAPTGPVRSGARVRLSVDYAETLDLELLQEAVRVSLDESGGRFEPQPAPVRRAP